MNNTVKGVEIDPVREKLIELLINSPGLCTLSGKEEEFAENADWLIANGATVQEWIPVTERLPKPNKLFCAGGNLTMAKRNTMDLLHSRATVFGMCLTRECQKSPTGCHCQNRQRGIDYESL